MLTPVTDDRRLTAKSEPMPDVAESSRYLMKCPDFIRAISTITAPKAKDKAMGIRAEFI
jgi:hypothetical protein